MTNPSNGWNEWSKHVLAELRRLNTCMEKIETEMSNLRSDIAVLKVKAGLWGAAAGAAPTAIAVLWYLVSQSGG